MDGQESTNDTVLGLCNGASGVEPGEEGLARLGQALDAALLALAVVHRRRRRGLDADDAAHGDGRAATPAQAEAVARAVANSPLVKTAFYGRDANWGRIMQAIGQALGRDGHEHLPARISYEDVVIVEQRAAGGAGRGPAGPARRDHAPARDRPDAWRSTGRAPQATVYFSDLTHDYVTLNAEYST